MFYSGYIFGALQFKLIQRMQQGSAKDPKERMLEEVDYL